MPHDNPIKWPNIKQTSKRITPKLLIARASTSYKDKLRGKGFALVRKKYHVAEPVSLAKNPKFF